MFTETTHGPRVHTHQKAKETITLCSDVCEDKVSLFHFLDITHDFNDISLYFSREEYAVDMVKLEYD